MGFDKEFTPVVSTYNHGTSSYIRTEICFESNYLEPDQWQHSWQLNFASLDCLHVPFVPQPICLLNQGINLHPIISKRNRRIVNDDHPRSEVLGNFHLILKFKPFLFGDFG